MNTNRHILLLSLCVLALATMCLLGVRGTMQFDEQRAAREQLVKRRLVAIRSAEEHYRTRHGSYTTNLDALVSAGLLPDSAAIVPYAGGKRFEVSVSADVSRTGRAVPLMECSATYADYLAGLDAASVASLTAEATAAGRFPGLKIGDLTTPNNNAGNWE